MLQFGVNDVASVNIDSKLVRGQVVSADADESQQNDEEAAPAGMSSLLGTVCPSSTEVAHAEPELLEELKLNFSETAFETLFSIRIGTNAEGKLNLFGGAHTRMSCIESNLYALAAPTH